VLARAGFEVEAFGTATLAIKSAPARLRHSDPAELLRGLLARWARAGAPSEDERVEQVLSEIACHSVVRAGDRLTTGEVESLLRGLDTATDTPRVHGRPLLLRLPLAEIARRFGR
jgi:DNA mismatch repair protein MutL